MSGQVRRRVRVGGAVAGCAVAAAGLFLGPGAAAAQRTVTVGSGADAWYQTAPPGACSSPVGCPAPVPSAASPYPAGTLHVGVVGGQQSAIAFVRLDLTAVPFGARLLGGTLLLPLAKSGQAGNANTATARLQACLVTKPIQDGVEGGTGAPPSYDCGQAKAPATAAKGGSSFTVNLGPLVAAWASGVPNLGL